MNEKKSAATSAATLNDGKDQILFDGFQSNSDCITGFVPAQGSVASFLLRGKEQALTRTQLADLTGMHWRRVTLMISRERKEGAPIISGTSGYWLPESQDELKRCIARLHRRAGEIHKTAAALEEFYGK